jgi:hypothetical protein
MSLLTDLQGAAETKLTNYASIPGKDAIKNVFLDLMALRPDGLSSIQWSAIDLVDFANILEAHRAELRPWITVYAAAFGLMGPWISIQNIWCRAGTPPTGQKLTPAVQDALDTLFSSYVTLITT